MAKAQYRILTPRMAVVALLLGGLLTVLSVPAAAWLARTQRGVVGIPTGESVRLEASADGWTHTALKFDEIGGTRWWSGHLVYPLTRPVPRRDPIPFRDDPRPAMARPLLREHIVDYARHGWPVPAAEGCLVEEPQAKRQVKWMARVPIGGGVVNVPLRPLWFGLLSNTGFFTGLALTPLVLLRWRRTQRRIKRGLCVGCGYELGRDVEVCPECGLEMPTLFRFL